MDLQKLIGMDPVYKSLIGIGILLPLIFGLFSWPVFLLIGVPIGIKLYATFTCGKTSSNRRLDGKVVIITGANAGMGYETTKELARRGGRIIMACRNLDKAKEAAAKIKKENPTADLIVMKLDISSLKSVREFTKKFLSEQTRLDVLIHNAGGPLTSKVMTEEGLETFMATNHFGPFLLTNSLLELMRKTNEARIIMVTGEMFKFAFSFDLDNLNSEKSFNVLSLFAKGTVAKILFTRELDRRFRRNGIKEVTVNAINPGFVVTDILNQFGQSWYMNITNKILALFGKTPFEGAQTHIHLSVAEEVGELSGLYWKDCHEEGITKLAQDVKVAKDLWERSVQVVGIKAEEYIFDITPKV